MATDGNLWFHGTSAAGTTIPGATGGTATFSYPTVDLGTSTVVRSLQLVRRLHGGTGGTALDMFFQDSTDGVTFSSIPAGGAGQRAGFARVTTHVLSTDSVAAPESEKILLRTDKRYVRLAVQNATSSVVWPGVSVVGKVLEGAYTGKVGPYGA